MLLKRLFRARPAEAARPPSRVPPGTRVYAIGDVHGRSDLLDRLIAAIDADDAARGAAETMLIFLGDLVDRGPDSAGVVERAMALKAAGRRVRFIKGNHEEVFLTALAGHEGAMRFFVRIGGEETLASYGIAGAEYRDADFDGLTTLAQARVPEAHWAFLDGFEDQVEVGDYLFVHAGVRPGVPLDAQARSDLRWIREPFLGHEGDHGRVIVHGHTISAEVEERGNRIGIDTGA